MLWIKSSRYTLQESSGTEGSCRPFLLSEQKGFSSFHMQGQAGIPAVERKVGENIAVTS